MTSIVARLEKATGPDDELFYECAHMAFGPSHNLTDIARWNRFSQLVESEAWTDAALMLVPEGLEWSVGRNSDGSFGAAVGNTVDLGDVEVAQQIKGGPAIALCIAAMKARAGKTK